jgi:hypothetical protein
MATGIETRILEALNAQLAALVLSPVVPIAWQNKSFTPSGAYLRPWLLPVRTDALTVSVLGSNDYAGLYQVDVFWPSGSGLTDPMERASAIAAHFKRGTRISREGITVRIDDPPWPGPALQEPNWIQVPVSVPYRAFVPNP